MVFSLRKSFPFDNLYFINIIKVLISFMINQIHQLLHRLISSVVEDMCILMADGGENGIGQPKQDFN